MLQNSRNTAFTVSELLRENQQGGGGGGVTPPTHTHTHTYTQIKIKSQRPILKIWL